MKKTISTILLMIILISFCSSCMSFQHEKTAQTIGILMPCSSNDNWKANADEMRIILEDKGYEVITYFAQKDADAQIEQINDSIENGADALIITPVSDADLSDVLNDASEKGIKIISYSKLIQNTAAVSYFAAYDEHLIGVQQGLSLVEGMRKNTPPPYNIEIFPKPYLDARSRMHYNGVMSVIQPLIDSNEIVVVSSEISLNDFTDYKGGIDAASNRLKTLLNDYYFNKPLHGIVSPSDAMSIEFINILNDDEYYSNRIYPIITGQNARIESVNAILEGQQYSTVFKDNNLLAQIACSMVISLLNDEIPEVNDNSTFYNGAKIVPAYLCEPILVTKDNYEQVLIDSGHYTYDEIFPVD